MFGSFIPDPLPQLAPNTISYYRRAGKPRFKADVTDNPHYVHESLWMLASIP